MYEIGDKIVYPMYGAGVIEKLENKTIEGKEENYYVIKMPIGNLTIMLSVNKAEAIGLRGVAKPGEVIAAMKDIAGRPIEMSSNWNQRYKENMEKIKTGNISEVAEVVRNLMLREKEKGLSSAEKKMLTSAKQIILSELILSKDIDRDEAEEILTNELFNI